MAGDDFKITTEDGKEFEVPVDGSLGLLALGYVGIMAWRTARQKAGIDLVGQKKVEWEKFQSEMKEKREMLAEKRKEFLEKRKANLGTNDDKKKGHDPSKDWTGQDKIS